MSEWGGAAGGEHPVLTAGAALGALAREVLGSSGLSLSPAQVREAVVSFHAGQQAVEAARLHLVRLLEATAATALHPGAATRHFLTDELGVGAGAARADVEAARATDPTRGVLRGLGAALADGRVTRAHVDVARRTLAHLPTGMVASRRDELDAVLTQHAKDFCPSGASTLGDHLVATIDPEGAEGFADEAFERRSWSTRVDTTGVVRTTGALDPAGGAQYLAVLGHLSGLGRPAACPDGGAGGDGGSGEDGCAGGQAELPGTGADLRTPSQRRADAVVEMARLAAAQLKVATPADPPRVVVHTTVEQLAWRAAARIGAGATSDAGAAAHPGPATCEQTGPLSSSTLHRLACDAVLERVVLDRAGAVVAVGSAGRLASRAQRRALAARDGGCTWPRCSAPPSWCDAHHLVWWSRGGPTVLGNLVLLCGRHHTEAHWEHWVVTMRDGVPWYVPPRWADPDQVPVRNTFHTAVAATRRVGARLARGHQLELGDLPPP